MTAKLTAILIDATNRTVTAVDYDDTLEHMYKLIGCDLIDTVYLDDKGTVAFVDDEGLLKDPDDFWLWKPFGEHAQAFAGNALVLGTGREGETISASMTADYVRERVEFKRKDDLRREQFAPHMQFIPLN